MMFAQMNESSKVDSDGALKRAGGLSCVVWGGDGKKMFFSLVLCPQQMVSGGSKVLNFLVKTHIQVSLLLTSRNVLKHTMQ